MSHEFGEISFGGDPRLSVVGTLIGMTSLGGGILLLPLLILILHVPPMIAIGSGTALAALRIAGATVIYWN